LRAAGFASGAPDPVDGRQAILSLTKKCQELIKTNRMAREDWPFQVIRTKLSLQEQKELARSIELLKRIVDSWSDRVAMRNGVQKHASRRASSPMRTWATPANNSLARVPASQWPLPPEPALLALEMMEDADLREARFGVYVFNPGHSR
jgi:hypothetical protein